KILSRDVCLGRNIADHRWPHANDDQNRHQPVSWLREARNAKAGDGYDCGNGCLVSKCDSEQLAGDAEVAPPEILGHILAASRRNSTVSQSLRRVREKQKINIVSENVGPHGAGHWHGSAEHDNRRSRGIQGIPQRVSRYLFRAVGWIMHRAATSRWHR